MNKSPVLIVGAGVGGLTAAISLAARGLEVEILERAATPGGKLRQVMIGDHGIDAGPTVFTMRWVFDELCELAGTTMETELSLHPVETLARHAWSAEQRLDLFTDLQRSADAIAAFADDPTEGRRFLDFSAEAQKIYQALKDPFICSSRPKTPLTLIRRAGPTRLLGIKPYSTLWSALGKHFRDPRLQQLFGRYATYCGSSPYRAPATLMLVAHVEQEGVWLVKEGMYQLVQALVRIAERLGVRIHYATEVTEILGTRTAANGVRLANGETLDASAVIVNADPNALATGKLGESMAGAIAPTPRAERSLSALTWNLLTPTAGFPLIRHSVFFSQDYASEFQDIFDHHRLPQSPTVYICAQDRTDTETNSPPGPERLLCLVNAPPIGDQFTFRAEDIEQCTAATFALLNHCGLEITPPAEATCITSPSHLERLFPATGGALYGRASHGWLASFVRPGARTKIPRLYLAGGSTHPGPGVPMAAMSGRIAAASVLADLTSTKSSPRAAIFGGTSMP